MNYINGSLHLRHLIREIDKVYQTMSQWVITLVFQRDIEPQSLAIRVSVTTTKPPRHSHNHPFKKKVCPHAF